ncbi:metallophosphoesterase [Cohnella sp. REN36]|uniref:metallophosphoesterase n=1 Tax=Cohnella sp. REN36 TaxID=2887347 RepID=UPI001D14C0D2|nr:metallophosphoesterase [Cohnella sp. REN36]MCC3376532.1 metallophosphoesterase [Cohnella sp. REN36]
MVAVLLAGTVLAAAAVAAGLYGTLVEPRRLSITRLEIASPHVPEGFDGKRIVQFSDTHVSPDFPMDRLEALIAKLNALEPDLLVFNGDLFDSRRRNVEENPNTSDVLSRLEAKIGKFAVYGNHDFGYNRLTRSVGPILTRAGFRVLINDLERVHLPSGESIVLAGLDDYILGRPKFRTVLPKLQAEDFNVLLAHEPDPATGFTHFPVDLQLSGHSHGGQVHLPILGALVRTKMGRQYVAGLYTLQGRFDPDRPYRLYVNRGIGTTRMRLRLGSVPEIAVFTLRRSR